MPLAARSCCARFVIETVLDTLNPKWGSSFTP